ncbi:hypothetical protein [Bradymonas sediminis]|uniref:Uncharacterized protein n=1 Tax=Bradymonas sediminis TaxID=1548548 RepID=A0A2Z4FNN2_9DELT|nr:hypothetical protein [Bradymonas sediminis]AWV90336.1 hypothetical protein DN745_13755 [Bradymonas sediminis]TDP75687.1 hypothetical protein DFR33_10326 [Bradymonas sediminis]
MLNKRNIAYFCAATLALSLVGVADADASTARRNSLQNNRLMLDREDVFAFPQLATQYANMVGFDYAAGAEQGNALLIMGDERLAYGVSMHRGNLFASEMYPSGPGNVLGGPNSPFGGALATFDARSGNIVDVFAGFDMGGGLLGGRLVLGNGGASINPANEAVDDQSAGEFYTVLQVGYSTTGHLAIDTALNLNFSTMSVDVGDETPLSGTHIGVGLDTRGIYEMRGQMDFGFVGGLAFQNTGVDRDVAGTTTSSGEMAFAIQAGAGPVWQIDSKRAAPVEGETTAAVSEGLGTTIAAYGILGYEMTSTDPDDSQDNDGSGTYGVLLPGVQLAADIELFDWLYFRSGAQYRWAIAGNSSETTDGDDTSSLRGPGATPAGYGDGFGWSTGLGVKVGDFTFDGTLANSFVLNGPNFIGGGSGFLTTASAEYTW